MSFSARTINKTPLKFLRQEMTSDPSNYHREYTPGGSYSLCQFEGSDIISALKKLNGVQLCDPWTFIYFKKGKHY